MPFENEKKMFLAKIDKSKKGSLDERIIPLFNIINQHPDYYMKAILTTICKERYGMKRFISQPESREEASRVS